MTQKGLSGFHQASWSQFFCYKRMSLKETRTQTKFGKNGRSSIKLDIIQDSTRDRAKTSWRNRSTSSRSVLGFKMRNVFILIEVFRRTCFTFDRNDFNFDSRAKNTNQRTKNTFASLLCFDVREKQWWPRAQVKNFDSKLRRFWIWVKRIATDTLATIEFHDGVFIPIDIFYVIWKIMFIHVRKLHH